MLAAFAKALAQMSDPRFMGVMTKAVLATVVLYALLIAGLSYGLTHLSLTAMPWLDSLIDWAGGIMVALLALLLFPGIVVTVLSFLLEDIARAVEKRHYPHLPEPRSQSLGETLGGTLRFALAILGVTLVALPFYAIPVVNLVAFPIIGVAANGYLLSREYFELVAVRRLDAAQADVLRRRYSARLWLMGMAFACLMLVPLVNLVAPVIATAAMVHVFESLRSKPQAA
ncbi:MAG: EI24 domain-containing protein [Rhodospirillales bacterium]|nr:EI24 domain-containing protein [Rhodospirillales bacterium]